MKKRRCLSFLVVFFSAFLSPPPLFRRSTDFSSLFLRSAFRRGRSGERRQTGENETKGKEIGFVVANVNHKVLFFVSLLRSAVCFIYTNSTCFFHSDDWPLKQTPQKFFFQSRSRRVAVVFDLREGRTTRGLCSLNGG